MTATFLLSVPLIFIPCGKGVQNIMAAILLIPYLIQIAIGEGCEILWLLYFEPPSLHFSIPMEDRLNNIMAVLSPLLF